MIYSSIFTNTETAKGTNVLLMQKYQSEIVCASIHHSTDGDFLFPSPQVLVLCLSLLIHIVDINLLLSLPRVIRPTDDAAKGLYKP